MSTERPSATLAETFGSIDVYLFDQLLKARLRPGMRVLDAGCGGGRNIKYLLQEGYDVSAVDRQTEAVESVRKLSANIGTNLPPEHFQVADIQEMPFPSESFDFVIANAVLHFSDDETSFVRGLDELWRVVAPGGLLFTRLSSDIGIEERLTSLGGRRFRLPNGPEWFLVDEAMMLAHTERLGALLVDPIKTTNVQGLRCMTTWIIGKPRN